ncbi:MAG: signal peptidase II [Phycisphaerales bacterium]
MLLVAVTVTMLAADLWSKSWAFANVADAPVPLSRASAMEADRLSDLLPAHEPIIVIPSVLEFTLVLNRGAVFGMAAGQRWFFVGFTAVAIVFCLWMFASWTRPKDRMAHIAIALVLAGGLGNLYDRLMFACVRDFLHFLPGVELPFGIAWPGGEREVWPYVSNVADAQLILGIAVLMWFSLRSPADESRDETEAADAAS